MRARGLSLDKAFERWSDPEKFRALQERSPTVGLAEDALWHADPERERSRKVTAAMRRDLEKAFQEKLEEGSVRVTGINVLTDRRETIDTELWERLEIDHRMGTAASPNWMFEELEFWAKPESLPAHAFQDSLQVPATRLSFTHDRDYRHVEFKGLKMRLGPTTCRVVAILHEAAQSSQPWLNGKKLLEQAGSSQTKLGDLFKGVGNWRELIESDGAGSYRLRLDPGPD